MTDKVENQAQEQAQEQAQAAATSAPDLNVQDLSAMKTIIDIASSRGAFKPNEMSAVGQVYTKLTAFLDAVTKQAQATQAATQQGQ